VDIDQDGHVDIVSGSYSRQDQDMAGTFQVLYGQSGGKFKKAEELKGSDGKPLVLPGSREKNLTDKICTRQFVVDWNGDGKLDLVTGNFAGGFFWFKGEGKGKFHPTAELITQKGKPLKLPPNGHHSDPFVVDFDGDGDIDLLSGSTDAGVYFAENTAGTSKTPELAEFKAVIFPVGKEWANRAGKALRENDLKRPTYGCRIWVDDVNGDGKLDILVGDQTTLVSPKPGISDVEMEKKYAEWQKDFSAAQEGMRNPRPVAKKAQAKAKANDKTDPAKVNPVVNLVNVLGDFVTASASAYEVAAHSNDGQQDFMRIYNRRTEFMKEETTGFVWLYVQK
jgi:hypothetical protein